MQKLHYIILGHGLAGASIAVQLLKHGKKILVIDKPSPTTASRVAAGLFNPITGRKMVKSWLADKLFPFLHQYYREVETLTACKFFYPMPVYRPFISIEEQN
ncbi:MAG TPA: FAD-dependent oxidoreductase, partial [Chryseolinea sp.]